MARLRQRLGCGKESEEKPLRGVVVLEDITN